MGPHRGPERPRAGDGPLRQQDGLHAALRLLSAGHVLQQGAVQAGRHRRAAEDAWTSSRPTRRRSSTLPGKSGYCLRGGPGGLNGWMMFGATMAGSDKFFNDDGTSTLSEPDWVKGSPFLVDLYKSGGAPKDSVNWGFNEIVAGFYSGTCAMLDQDPDALIAIARAHEARGVRRHHHAQGPERPRLSDARLCRLVDVRQQPEQGPALEADRDARRPGGQHRLEQAHRRAADLQGGRERPVLRGRAVQGLVRRAERQGRRAARHADLPAGLRLFRRFDRGEDRASRRCSARSRPRR